MQHGDTVEYFWDSEGSTVFAHTAIRPDGSVEEQTIPEKFYPNFYDEYAAYDIWGTTCKRLDWQTGELTTASLPFVQLDGVPGAVGSRVLLTLEAIYDKDGNFSTAGDQTPVTYEVELKGTSDNGTILRNGYYRVAVSLAGLTGQDVSATITVADWETPVTQNINLGQ